MSITLSVKYHWKQVTNKEKDIMQSIPYPNDTSNISHFYKSIKFNRYSQLRISIFFPPNSLYF